MNIRRSRLSYFQDSTTSVRNTLYAVRTSSLKFDTYKLVSWKVNVRLSLNS